MDLDDVMNIRCSLFAVRCSLFVIRFAFVSCFIFYFSEKIIKIVHPTTVISLFHSYFLPTNVCLYYSFQTPNNRNCEIYDMLAIYLSELPDVIMGMYLLYDDCRKLS